MAVSEKRLQIYLSASDYRALRDRAHAEGRSIAGVVREAVSRYLTTDPRAAAAQGYRDLLAGAGACRDDKGDASERHDDYLGEGRW